MMILCADGIPWTRRRGGRVLGCLLALVFLQVGAFSTPARAESIVTVLVPVEAKTTDPVQSPSGHLTVAAARGKYPAALSTLTFDLSVLPAPVSNSQITSVRLQLVPKEGAERPMAIKVALAASGVEDGKPKALGGQLPSRLVSPPLPKNAYLRELRTDGVNLPPSVIGEMRASPAMRLQLLAEGNASYRIYYGLNTQASALDIAHPERQPRLIITYNAASPRDDITFSEPSPLSLSQTDGRKAASSLAGMNLRAGELNGGGSEEFFDLQQVAADSLTAMPAVYQGGLYLVRKQGAATYLQQFSSATGQFSGAQLLLPHDVRPGSPMVVDDHGRLRIITNDAILGTTVDPLGKAFSPLVKRHFAFGATPRIVIPGRDGTLYFVKDTIFAMNPDVWRPTPDGRQVPVKLWELAIDDPDTARITLNPDGTFVYVLARFAGRKSRFIAVNAQTGKDIALDGGVVNTAGKSVSWVSGMNFEGISVGQSIPLGALSCTVASLNSNRQRLTCMEDLGNQNGIRWASFPDNLIAFRNPVVSKTPQGDLIYITGHTQSAAYLWGVRNDPVMYAGSGLARFTSVWNYLSNGFNYMSAYAGQQTAYSTTGIGQPILDTTLPSKGERPARKELYFLEKGAFNYPGSLLSVVNATNGKLLRAYPLALTVASPQGQLTSLEADLQSSPILDKDGKIVLWSDDHLWLVSANGGYNFRPLKLPAAPQLFFGAGGSLFSAGSSSLNFLSPKPAR